MRRQGRGCPLLRPAALHQHRRSQNISLSFVESGIVGRTQDKQGRKSAKARPSEADRAASKADPKPLPERPVKEGPVETSQAWLGGTCLRPNRKVQTSKKWRKTINKRGPPGSALARNEKCDFLVLKSIVLATSGLLEY